VPFERDGRRFTLIDTAGVRRRARIDDAIERASVGKTLQAIAAANIVIMVLDAHDSVAEQDAAVLGLAFDRGRALIIAVNKWDGIPVSQRETIHNDLKLRLDFVPFAPVFFISARHGTGVGDLAKAAIRAHEAAFREMSTPLLTRVLEKALEQHQPPLVKGRRIKLRYAHQGGKNPPRIVVHGTQTGATPDAYKRYLSNVFREAFDLYASPVALELRTEANPYDRRRDEKQAAQGRPAVRRQSRGGAAAKAKGASTGKPVRAPGQSIRGRPDKTKSHPLPSRGRTPPKAKAAVRVERVRTEGAAKPGSSRSGKDATRGTRVRPAAGKSLRRPRAR